MGQTGLSKQHRPKSDAPNVASDKGLHCLPLQYCFRHINTLQKYTYSNTLKILPPKNESFQIKIMIFFIFLLKIIDCGYSLELPRHNLCFWAEIRKIMYIPVYWKFSDKKTDICHISAQNIDYGYSLELPCWGGSNEYPPSMFFSRNKKNNVYPCKPQFYYIKVGFKGSKLVFLMM